MPISKESETSTSIVMTQVANGGNNVDWGTVALIVVGVATVVVYWLIYGVSKRQAESDDRIETIQRRQAEALERMASALIERFESSSAVEDRDSKTVGETKHERIQESIEGSMLSARFEKDGRTDRLVMSNSGPGFARVISVQVLNAPDLLVEPLGLDNLVLFEGEEHRILAAPTLATPQPVKVRMIWINARGVQSREQNLNL